MSSKDLPLKEFEITAGGVPLMKLSLGMTLFLPKPFAKQRAGVADLWKKLVAWLGKDAFTWARLGGGNRSRKVAPPVFKTIDDWLAGRKDYGPTCWISIHDGEMDKLGTISFLVEGHEEMKYHDDGYVELELPLRLLDEPGPDAVAKRLTDLAAEVPFSSGVAGFFMHHSPYHLNHVIQDMARLSRRFEGVEVTANDSMQYWAPKGLTTVNWITFVGDALLDKLGGRAAVAKKTPDGCRLSELRHGVAFRCGEAPSVGDRNSGKDDLALWRKLYQVLKPVQFVDPQYKFDYQYFDGEATADWLRRLDR